MKISKNGLVFIKENEICKYKSYKDSSGLLLIGCNHLIRPDEQWMNHTTLTDEQIIEILTKDIHVAENAINNFVKKPLTQNQFDALVSLVFNIGDGVFEASTLLVKLNINPNDNRFIKVNDIINPNNQWMKQQLIQQGKNVIPTIYYSWSLFHKINHQPNQQLWDRRNREYKLYSTK